MSTSKNGGKIEASTSVPIPMIQRDNIMPIGPRMRLELARSDAASTPKPVETEATPPAPPSSLSVANEPFLGQHFLCVPCGNRAMWVEGTYTNSKGIKRYRKCQKCGHVITTMQRHGDVERLGG